MNKLLEEDIKTSDTLYIAGYFPNAELLKYFNKKMIFVGDDDTVYFSEPDPTDNNIISCGLLKDYFDKYYLIFRETGNIILCDSLEDIDNKINNLFYKKPKVLLSWDVKIITLLLFYKRQRLS
jgi:hypothetical protein